MSFLKYLVLKFFDISFNTFNRCSSSIVCLCDGVNKVSLLYKRQVKLDPRIEKVGEINAKFVGSKITIISFINFMQK